MDYTALGEVTEAMMKDEQGTEGGREIYWTQNHHHLGRSRDYRGSCALNLTAM